MLPRTSKFEEAVEQERKSKTVQCRPKESKTLSQLKAKPSRFERLYIWNSQSCQSSCQWKTLPLSPTTWKSLSYQVPNNSPCLWCLKPARMHWVYIYIISSIVRKAGFGNWFSKSGFSTAQWKLLGNWTRPLYGCSMRKKKNIFY